MEPSPKNQTKHRQPPRNIFTDPAIAEAAQDDPVIQYFVQNWRSILTVVVAIPLLMFGYNTFRSTNEAKRAAASATFGEIRNVYTGIQTEDEQLRTAKKDLEKGDAAKKDELTKKVTELEGKISSDRDRIGKMLQSLEETGIQPFPVLARLYRGLLAARDGNSAQVRTLLGGISWENVTPVDSNERLVAELSALVAGRSLLDTPDSVKEGQALLLKLAQQGQFTRTQAALALAAVAETPEDKSTALAAIEKLQADQPEQQKFLTDAVDRLKQ